MKAKTSIYKVLLPVLLLTLNLSCKKDNNVSPQKESKQIEEHIIASVGGVLTTSDSIRLIIPPNALSVDGIAFVGRTGLETTSVPNPTLQVLGSPITVRIPSDTIRKPVTLTYQLPSEPSNPENCLVFLYNGTTYYPVAREIIGKTVNVSIDVIDWEARTNKKSGGLFTTIICNTLFVKQTPSPDQLGLKEVTFQSGTMIFTKPQSIGSSSKVVVLIHGWTGRSDGWSTFMQKLQKEKNPSYTNYLTFGYNSSLSIEDNAQTLANSLETYAKGAKIDIIAHSMGGLVSRSAIEHFNGARSNRRLITLGTPHLGAPEAAIRYVIGLLVAMDSGLYGFLIYDYKTQGLRDLYTKSNYITRMKTLSFPPIPYYTIAAINDVGAILYGHLNFGFLIDGPNDGVVAVASALGVQGAESPPYAPFYIPVALAHMQMTEDATIYMCIINYLKDPVAKPTISTSVLLPSITTTSAQCGGVITSDGNAAITSSGICWSTFTNPTISDNRTSDGTLTGSFLSTISGLTPHTIYYVRAYATNSAGTGYGNEVSFTTSVLIQSPILSTAAASSISTTSATSGGSISSDGGATVTARGVCWSTTSNPTVSNSKTTDGTGTGSFTSSLTGLTASTTYYVKAYATNSIGTAYGNELSFSTPDFPNCGKVTDIDGNEYNTVTIGSQCWLRENLKTTKYNDGTVIQLVTDDSSWNNLTTPGYCWYNNDAANNKNTYGALYNWYTVNTGKLCPTGWHVPTDAEWTILTTYLGGESIAGGKLKETGTIHWLSPNTGATDTFGFSAVPGGSRYPNGTFGAIGSHGFWWSSTENVSTYAWIRYMYNYFSEVYRAPSAPTGLSVRCLKGESTIVNRAPQQPTSPNPDNNATGISLSTTLSWTCSDPENDPLTYDVYFGTSPNPSTKVSADQTANSYSPTNLTAGIDYYWKIVAKDNKNNSNTGPVWKFTTAVAVQYPTVTTTSVTSFTTTSAVSGGNISSDGGASVIARGVCWSTSQNPTIAGTKTTDGIGSGSFTSAITGLAPNTTYYVRSYAINSVGTSYGSQVSFTTSVQTQLPTLTTTAASAISTTSATSGGSISSDGGAIVTARGVCWSTSQTPTTANNKTTDGTGTGSFTSSLTGLTASTTYYVRAYATNSVGTSYGSQVSITTTSNSGGTVTDIDGNVYNTVTIGTQVWMVENLKTTKYNDGTSIPNVTDNTAWRNLATTGYCWYNNDPATYKNTYGALYNWLTVNTGKLAPTGWHVPTDAEWTTLTTFLGGESVAGGKLKETGTTHWQSINTGATNSSGFTALPGGYRSYSGPFDGIGYGGMWWSSTETSAANAWARGLNGSVGGVSNVGRGPIEKGDGYSVRCLRD